MQNTIQMSIVNVIFGWNIFMISTADKFGIGVVVAYFDSLYMMQGSVSNQ